MIIYVQAFVKFPRIRRSMDRKRFYTKYEVDVPDGSTWTTYGEILKPLSRKLYHDLKKNGDDADNFLCTKVRCNTRLPLFNKENNSDNIKVDKINLILVWGLKPPEEILQIDKFMNDVSHRPNSILDHDILVRAAQLYDVDFIRNYPFMFMDTSEDYPKIMRATNPETYDVISAIFPRRGKTYAFYALNNQPLLQHILRTVPYDNIVKEVYTKNRILRPEIVQFARTAYELEGKLPKIKDIYEPLAEALDAYDIDDLDPDDLDPDADNTMELLYYLYNNGVDITGYVPWSRIDRWIKQTDAHIERGSINALPMIVHFLEFMNEKSRRLTGSQKSIIRDKIESYRNVMATIPVLDEEVFENDEDDDI